MKFYALMKIALCEKMKGDDSGRETRLSAFDPVLVEGVSGSSLSHKLMMSSVKKYRYNDQNFGREAMNVIST